MEICQLRWDTMRELWKHFKIDDYDIRIDECGIQQFKPAENYSYRVYQNYVIHYIEEGIGTFNVDNNTYTLTSNEGFILRQGQHVTYYADHNKPWRNYWVGFSGEAFDKFIKYTSLEKEHIVHYEKNSEIIKTIQDICEYTLETTDDDMNLFWYQTNIYRLLYALSSEFPSKKHSVLMDQGYEEVAYEYISNNYHKQISINEVAAYIGISRSYLYKLFKEKYHISPQEFLIQKRMNKAVDFLLHTNKPINIIAREVGYYDQLHFSKAFKTTYGVSPTEFKHINNVENFI